MVNTVLVAFGFLMVEVIVFLKSQKPGWYKRGGMSYSAWRKAVGMYYCWHLTLILAAALTVISYFSTTFDDVLLLTDLGLFLFATKLGKGFTAISSLVTLSGLFE